MALANPLILWSFLMWGDWFPCAMQVWHDVARSGAREGPVQPVLPGWIHGPGQQVSHPSAWHDHLLPHLEDHPIFLLPHHFGLPNCRPHHSTFNYITQTTHHVIWQLFRSGDHCCKPLGCNHKYGHGWGDLVILPNSSLVINSNPVVLLLGCNQKSEWWSLYQVDMIQVPLASS